MLRSVIEDLNALMKDESGALTTLEVIGYTVLIGGAIALVGYGVTAMARGKLGSAMNAVGATKAMSGVITGSSTSAHTLTVDSATGMATAATGN